MRKALAVPPAAAQLARYRDPVKVQIFYDSMMKMGISFELDQAGRVVATGRAVSPLIQSETDHRADVLRQIIEKETGRRRTGGKSTAEKARSA